MRHIGSELEKTSYISSLFREEMHLLLAPIMKTPPHMMQELILACISLYHTVKVKVLPNISVNYKLSVKPQEDLGWR